MPERHANAEAAHVLLERAGKHPAAVELLEAFLLALVAIATAWSGYQAARWDGRSAERYTEATAHRVEGDQAAILGGQQRLQDIATFNAWLQAHALGEQETDALFVRRFSDEYRVAFEAWLRTDPFRNPSAPAAPIHMSEYHNASEAQAADLVRRAHETFAAGREAREIGEDYVRVTVFLGTVLFLVALSQRFRSHGVRVALLSIAGVLVLTSLYLVIAYPRA